VKQHTHAWRVSGACLPRVRVSSCRPNVLFTCYHTLRITRVKLQKLQYGIHIRTTIRKNRKKDPPFLVMITK